MSQTKGLSTSRLMPKTEHEIQKLSVERDIFKHTLAVPQTSNTEIVLQGGTMFSMLHLPAKETELAAIQAAYDFGIQHVRLLRYIEFVKNHDLATYSYPDLPDQWSGVLADLGSSQSPSANLKIINEKLEKLKELPDNWAGKGSMSINPVFINSAKQLVDTIINHIKIIPYVVPLTNGSLQLEWNTENRSLELELEDTSTIRYLKWDPRFKIEEEDSFKIGMACHKAIELINWFNEDLSK